MVFLGVFWMNNVLRKLPSVCQLHLSYRKLFSKISRNVKIPTFSKKFPGNFAETLKKLTFPEICHQNGLRQKPSPQHCLHFLQTNLIQKVPRNVNKRPPRRPRMPTTTKSQPKKVTCVDFCCDALSTKPPVPPVATQTRSHPPPFIAQA